MDPRQVQITFNERLRFFQIFSKDGKPVFQGRHAYEEIKKRGWFAASDGHVGTNAIVIAPKDAQNELESYFF